MLYADETTVGQVRTREGGPPPGFSPAAVPWESLPATNAAAWCTIEAGGQYSAVAATTGGHPVTFMVSADPLGDLGPDGPAIP